MSSRNKEKTQENPKDSLGEFLTQYEEYLNGDRSYSDLPVACTNSAKAPRVENQHVSTKK